MQLLAIVTMLIDHIGLLFFPEDLLWRIIGRIAFPLYTFGIVQGLRYTRSRKKYLVRLILIGFLAQGPYMILTNQLQVNVIGTFIIILAVLMLLERSSSRMNWIIVAVAAVSLQVLPFEYGAYALLLALAYRYLNVYWIVAAHVGLNWLAQYMLGWEIQHYSILATLLIVSGPKLLDLINRLKVPRWIWRSFYPAHLFILVLIESIT